VANYDCGFCLKVLELFSFVVQFVFHAKLEIVIICTVTKYSFSFEIFQQNFKYIFGNHHLPEKEMGKQALMSLSLTKCKLWCD